MRSVRILHSIVTRGLRCFVGGLIGFLFALVMVHRLDDGADGPRVGVPSFTGYFGRVDSGLVVRALGHAPGWGPVGFAVVVSWLAVAPFAWRSGITTDQRGFRARMVSNLPRLREEDAGFRQGAVA